MFALTDDNFDQEVLFSDGLTLVDMWATWCGPCRRLSPILESFASNNPQVKVCKMNVEEAPVTSDRYAISAIPTLLFFKNGQVVKKFTGVQSEQTLSEAIQSL